MVNATSESFPHRVRIVRSSDYRRLYREGRKIPSARFVLFVRENGSGHHRLGITVSRKVGNAVVRNRVKRLFREIFRRSFAQIPSQYDMVVNAKPSCAGVSYTELRDEFLASARRLCP